MRNLLLAAALMLGAWGCGDDCAGANYVCGSATSINDMADFEDVRVRLATTEVSVEYFRRVNGGEEIPLKLAVSFAEEPIVEGVEIDLVQRAEVTTNPPTESFPPVESGHIVFDSYRAEAGATASGSFQASLGRLGLSGHFSAEIDDIND